MVSRVADDERSVAAHAESVWLPERRFDRRDSVACVEMMFGTGSGNGPDRATNRVDFSNNIVLALDDVQQPGPSHRDSTWAVEGRLQRIAAVSRETRLASSRDPMNQPGLEFQTPDHLTFESGDPQISAVNRNSLRRVYRLVPRETAVLRKLSLAVTGD